MNEDAPEIPIPYWLVSGMLLSLLGCIVMIWVYNYPKRSRRFGGLIVGLLMISTGLAIIFTS